MKKYILNILLWSVVLSGAFLIYNRVNTTPPIDESIPYSDFIAKVKNKLVDRVEMSGQTIKLRTADGQNFETYNPNDPHLID
ncbi:MAG: ATP-dependent metallopeptidase FtsH/Yme1/Tma family protein, partial [Bacteroidota bacterium]|nr:ATP-dependent metallopeptidase FtsH/Yme1/Tma family protein [Bacteroidota bacterium]